MDRAGCVGRPDLPWTLDAHLVPAGDRPGVRVAMGRVCAACPVRAQCVDLAGRVGASAGWWAGTYDDHPPTTTPAPAPGYGSAPVPATAPAPVPAAAPGLVLGSGWVPFTRPGSGGPARWEQSVITFGGLGGAA